MRQSLITTFEISFSSEFLLEPLADFMPRLGRKSSRLDLHFACCVHGQSDAGYEFVGEDFEWFAFLFADGDFAVGRVDCGDHFLDFTLRDETGCENEFLRMRGIDLAGGEPFERSVSTVRQFLTVFM